MINEILHGVEESYARTAYLKQNSDYWPEVFFKREQAGQGTEIYASTLARIERDGIWYVVHHIHSVWKDDSDPDSNLESYLVINLSRQVHISQQFYQVSTGEFRDAFGRVKHFQEVDKIQLSEKERLIERYPHLRS